MKFLPSLPIVLLSVALLCGNVLGVELAPEADPDGDGMIPEDVWKREGTSDGQVASSFSQGSETSDGRNGHAGPRSATIPSLRAGTKVAQSSSQEGEVVVKSAADFVEKDSDATKAKISDTANDDSSSSASPPSVCVIGCGPGGMFFLHALATRREKLRRAGNTVALRALPNVDVYEKKSSPGGVWRSATAEDDVESEDGSAQMYEALWINANKVR